MATMSFLKKSLLKSGGIAALVAGAAMFALPAIAHAEEVGEGGREHDRWNAGARPDGDQPQIERSGGFRGGEGGQSRDWQQRAQPAPVVVQQQSAAQPQQNWGGSGGGGWGRRAEQQAPVVIQQSTPPVVAQQQAPAMRQSWSGRTDNGGNGDNGGRWGGRWGGQQQAQPQAQPQAQAQPQSGWRGGGQAEGWQNGGRQSGGWQSGNGSNPPERRVEAPRGDAGGNWNERNRGSADRQDPWRNGRQAWNNAERYGQHQDHWRNDTNNWNRGNPWQGNGRNGYGSDYRRWDNDWRRDNRYNWYSYRSNHRDLYRLDRYYAPYRNYYYSRVNIGFFLDSLFYSNRYWIDDPWQYRLPEAYGPYRWVRYYDDALLVDVYSGEVVDVIRDFFW